MSARERPSRGTPAPPPFGPGDDAGPDVRRVLRQAAQIRAELEAAQVELTRMRHGPGPDGTPPLVREVSRADGFWPFLVIRYKPSDIGARPLSEDEIAESLAVYRSSPDIMVVPAGPPGEPEVIDRDGFPALAARAQFELELDNRYDVWVHVWNLGQAPATGVRVCVWVNRPSVGFVGGRQFDLGDRLSATAHRLIKAATFTADSATWAGMTQADAAQYGPQIIATAECMSDVASDDRSFGMDRHTAHRYVFASGG